MKEKLIQKYINNLSVDDIKNFANKNNIELSLKEYVWLLNIIKHNWKTFLYEDPNSLFKQLKVKLTNTKYNQIVQLYQIYKDKYSHYL